jgi:hypothetical protein
MCLAVVSASTHNIERVRVEIVSRVRSVDEIGDVEMQKVVDCTKTLLVLLYRHSLVKHSRVRVRRHSLDREQRRSDCLRLWAAQDI